jgi:8-oxo-dGTP pyrophosphatase MutT (NUDIX family)
MTQFFVAAHALIEKDGLFLVTKRSTVNDYMPGLWDIPGGTVESGEVMETSLIREIFEESGLSIDIHEPLYIHTNLGSLPDKQYFQSVYRCSYLGGEVVLNPEEHDEYRWLTLDEMRSLPCIAFLKSFLEKN